MFRPNRSAPAPGGTPGAGGAAANARLDTSTVMRYAGGSARENVGSRTKAAAVFMQTSKSPPSDAPENLDLAALAPGGVPGAEGGEESAAASGETAPSDESEGARSHQPRVGASVR